MTTVRKTVRLADQLVQAWQNHEGLDSNLIVGRAPFNLVHEVSHVLTGTEYTRQRGDVTENPYLGESAVKVMHSQWCEVLRAMERNGLNWQQACGQVAALLPEDYPQRAALERLSVLGEKSPTALQLRGLRIEFHDDGKGSCDSYSTRPPTWLERVQDYTVNLVHDARRGLIPEPAPDQWDFDSVVDRVGCHLQTMLWKNDARQR